MRRGGQRQEGRGPWRVSTTKCWSEERHLLRKLGRKDKTREEPGCRVSSQGTEEGKRARRGKWGLR